MRVALVVLGTCLALTACGGGGSVDAMSPLNVSQKLEEANIPCDKPELDRRDAQDAPLGFSNMVVNSPPQTLLACGTPGGPFQVVIWETGADSEAVVRSYCLQQSISAFYDEQGVEYGSALTDFDRPDLGVGSNWIARATKNSIVSTSELAQALGGEVKSPDALCTPFERESSDVVASERQRLAEAEAEEEAAQRKQEAQASLEAVLADPTQALVAANSESTPPSMLVRLAQESEDFRVGCVLAKNKNLPAWGFAALAAKDYPDMLPRTKYEDGTTYRGQVGVCLAESAVTPDDVLQTLLQSEYGVVRKAAQAAIRNRS